MSAAIGMAALWQGVAATLAGKCRGGRLLRLFILLVGTACDAECDVGYSIEAVFAGTSSYEVATIVQIDLATSTLLVDWASNSPSHRTVTVANTQKDGAPCTFNTNTGQSFTASAGEKTHFLVTGSNLTEACRLHITGSSKVCGEPSASQDAAVTSRPGVPIGVGNMYFFDVVVDIAATYKVCFWSGNSVGGKGEADIASYATTLGPLTVSQVTTTTTTTTVGTVVFSRRRGLSYTSASFRVDGSSGFTYEGLTANPAAWNVHLPYHRDATCRSCQHFSMSEVDSNVQQLEVNRISGDLKAAPAVLPTDLGEGCEDSALVNVTAQQAPATVLLVRRGGCSFEEKARVAATAGYGAVLVIDYLADNAYPLPDMTLADPSEETSRLLPPAWFLPKGEGDTIFSLLSANAVLSASLDDIERKPQLASSMSDNFGVRSYDTK